jgi:hypothetical protein
VIIIFFPQGIVGTLRERWTSRRPKAPAPAPPKEAA